MKIVFDVDFDRDDLAEKLRELRDLENALEVKYNELKATRNHRLRKDGELWLSSLPEKPF
mgnify:CR=1 FL=1